MKFLPDEKGKLIRQRERFIPCPYCGGEHIALDRHSLVMSIPPFEEDHFAYCEDCGAHGPDAHNIMAATRRWNNRDSRNAPTVGDSQ